MTTTLTDAPVAIEGGTTPFDVPDVPDEFRICDEQSANWLVRKVVEARGYADHVRQWADIEIRRAENEEKFFLGRFEFQLRAWAAQQLTKTKGKRKSINLPAGVVGFRNALAKLVIMNDVAALTWARRELPTAIKVTESLSKTQINEHFDATGELPSGVELEPAKEVFYVR